MTISDEKRLTKYLQHTYRMTGRGGRPVFNTSHPTEVLFGLGLIQMDLDERNKVLTTSVWTRIRWTDEYLTWDPSEFGGVTSVRLEADEVWIPDIMLFNTADPEGAARNALVIVMYDGTVQWVPHQIFKSSCSIDVSNFPFDHQQCHMWFGSWTYTKKDIDLNLAVKEGIDLATFQSDYKDSCEWDIFSSLAEKKLLPPGDANPIAVLSFTLNLQRKVVFSSYILTLPCIFLASLTLVVFCLPPDRPDRTGLAMNLFSSFLVLLLILVEAAPPTASSVPTLGVYYCFNLVIIMLSIFLSSITINIYRAGERRRPVPKVIKLFLLVGLAKPLCVHLRERTRMRKSHSTDDTAAAEKLRGFVRKSENITRPVFGMVESFTDNANEKDGYENVNPSARSQRDIDSQLREIKQSLNQMTQTNKVREAHSAHVGEIIREWRAVAQVLDRLFCLLYFVAIIVSLVTLFPQHPNFTIH